ncbi:hypothetical protein ACIQFU_10770 [Streptomyces sp. NPDC093065]|uniref:hypothetical protein n=1 Tax=Streptomyces sp. NPDC093065 TaxID=3366021 RepID=UPI00381639D2
MTSDRSASPSGARLSRVVALTAGATLGLGALCAVPLATAGSGNAEATDAVALAADTTAPAVTLGATSVEPGGQVPFTAAGFPAGGTLSVKLDDTTLLGQFPVGDDGSVAGRVTIPAGASPGGGHWLRFLAPQTSVRSENLTVTATTPSPSPTPEPTPTPKPTPSTPVADPKVRLTGGAKVTAGGRTTFALSGFAKGQNVTVKLDDETILGQWPGAVKADGTFTGTVTIPRSAAAGAHWLRILAPGPATSLKADITVTAPASGGTGNGGTGGSGSGNGGAGSGSAGGSGQGGSGAAGGSGTAGGSSSAGGSGSSAGAAATITAGSRVAAGDRVSFRVTGFPAGRRLTVKLDDTKILGQWTVGADGSYAGGVTVPAGTAKGTHWLRFLSPDPPTSLRADFTVTSAASGGAGASAVTAANGKASATPVPAASGAPASATNDAGAKAEITASRVQPGGTLHFRVTGFPAGEQVTVKLDDEGILGQWDADDSGGYEGDVAVPADTPTGDHWLRFLAPNPPTSLKVEFTVTAGPAGDAQSSSSSSAGTPDTTAKTLIAATVASPVSYATIAWSAAAAAVGGAAGAAATTFCVVRRRASRPAEAG